MPFRESVLDYTTEKIKRPKVKFDFQKNKIKILVGGAILLVAVLFLTGPLRELSNLQQTENALQAQLSDLKNENQGIRDNIEYYKTDAYVEKAARENLGYIMPGEQVLYPYEKDEKVVSRSQLSGNGDYQD